MWMLHHCLLYLGEHAWDTAARDTLRWSNCNLTAGQISGLGHDVHRLLHECTFLSSSLWITVPSERTDSPDPFTAAPTIPGGPELLLTHLKWDCWVVDLHTDLRPAIWETLKDKNVDQWRCGELAHVTAAANGGWPEIKRDMGVIHYTGTELLREWRRSDARKQQVACGIWSIGLSLSEFLQCARMLFLCHPGIARLARGRWDAGFAVVGVQRIHNSF